MELIDVATAGTMESNDIMVTLTPRTEGGVQIELSSNVYQQFGSQIEAVIRETLARYGVRDAEVVAADRGALDCTIRARVSTAVFRSARSQEFCWEVGSDVS